MVADLPPLTMAEQSYGKEHPKVAIILNNLGMLYEMQQKHSEAKSMFQRALRILEMTSGPDDPNTQLVKANLQNL